MACTACMARVGDEEMHHFETLLEHADATIVDWMRMRERVARETHAWIADDGASSTPTAVAAGVLDALHVCVNETHVPRPSLASYHEAATYTVRAVCAAREEAARSAAAAERPLVAADDPEWVRVGVQLAARLNEHLAARGEVRPRAHALYAPP